MKLTVAAATGKTGRQIVEQALAAGHDVTAVARNPSGFDDRVRIVRTELSPAGAVPLETAIAGADAVLSGLGARSRADAGIAQSGTRAILDAMRATQVNRLVLISATPVGTVASPLRPRPPAVDPGDDLLTGRVLMPVLRKVFAEVYADLARMEDDVTTSGLDWTIVRPPRLTTGPLTSHYRTSQDANVRKGRTISRADLAHAMLAAASDPARIGQILRVGY
jgi:putative NADH-flavin reductase